MPISDIVSGRVIKIVHSVNARLSDGAKVTAFWLVFGYAVAASIVVYQSSILPRIDALAAVPQMRTDWTNLKKQINDLIETVDQKVLMLEQRMASIDGVLDRASVARNGLAKRIDGEAKARDFMSRRIHQLSIDQQPLATRIDLLRDRLNLTNQKLNQMERTQ